jgi:hypothetical protein
MARSLFARCGLLAVLILSGVAWAEDRITIADFSPGVDAKGVPAGWQLKEKSGKAEFEVVKDGDLHALHLKSSNTSFSIQKEINVDVKKYPILSWKWKVTKLPAGGDFRKSRTDDQAAQLFIGFTRAKTIVYLWDTSAPQGLMEDAASPPFVSIKAVVVRSGPVDTGKWIAEARNVYEDYKKLFGDEPPPAKGVRLQINSQHTETSTESWFADVVFRKQ